jgi:hypothetical protein
MATMTETGTEKRLDDLRIEMHRSFDQVDQRFDRVEADVRELRSDTKAGFGAMDARFDSLQRMMIGFFATTLGSVIAGVVVLLASHS